MTPTNDDWLDVASQREAATPLTREQQHARAIEFAKLYVETFVLNPSGAKLLAHWDETMLKYRVPVNAPINEYVHAEARRAFIQQIYTQLELARSPERIA